MDDQPIGQGNKSEGKRSVGVPKRRKVIETVTTIDVSVKVTALSRHRKARKTKEGRGKGA